MKLAIIICLAMFAAVCAATNEETLNLIKRLLESRAGVRKTPEFKNVQVLKSKELTSKLRNLKMTKTKTIAHKHVTPNCEDAHIELEDTNGDIEEGMILYPNSYKSILPTARRSKQGAGACTFHIHPDSDHVYVVYVSLNYTGNEYPACNEQNGLGFLTFYGGDSEESPELGRLCGQYEFAFIPYTPELFISFTPDPASNVTFFIYYEILSRESVLGSVDLGEDEPAGQTGAFPGAGQSGAHHGAGQSGARGDDSSQSGAQTGAGQSGADVGQSGAYHGSGSGPYPDAGQSGAHHGSGSGPYPDAGQSGAYPDAGQSGVYHDAAPTGVKRHRHHY